MHIINKDAKFHYHILESWEAGIVLTGSEVRAVKNKQLQLKGSYVSVSHDELWLAAAHITPYQPRNKQAGVQLPNRPRKLLLAKKQLISLKSKLTAQGLTIVPIKVYTKGALIKVEIALVRGKKQYDKRAATKKREIDRQLRQASRRKP